MRLLFVVIMLVLVPTVSTAWTITQNFDTQGVGTTCGNWGAAGRSKVTNGTYYSGPNACKVEIHTTDGCPGDCGTGYGNWGGVIGFPSRVTNNQELWIRLKIFFPTGFDYNVKGGRLKFMRVKTTSDAVSNRGADDLLISPYPRIDKYLGEPSYAYPYAAQYENAPAGPNVGSQPVGKDPTDNIQHNQWQTYEWYIKFNNVPASSGGTARMRVWRNGELIGTVNNSKTLYDTLTYATSFYLFTYWNGGTPKDQAAYIDDLLITTDTPSARDSAGNPYIGTGVPGSGGPAPISNPNPPVIQ